MSLAAPITETQTQAKPQAKPLFEAHSLEVFNDPTLPQHALLQRLGLVGIKPSYVFCKCKQCLKRSKTFSPETGEPDGEFVGLVYDAPATEKHPARHWFFHYQSRGRSQKNAGINTVGGQKEGNFIITSSNLIYCRSHVLSKLVESHLEMVWSNREA